MDLERLLFQEPLRADGRPLFDSQVDLALAVKNVPGTGFDRSDKQTDTVRAFINQVLRTKRPMSPNLRSAIEGAVQERLSDQNQVTRILHELDLGFTALEKSRRSRHAPLDDAEEFDALESASEQAQVHFIVTYTPAEATLSPKADRLRRQLVSNLDLVSPIKGGELRPMARYFFHFPDKSFGIDFWKKLERFLIDALAQPAAEVQDRLAKVEAAGYLEVYELQPAFLCVFPCVVFDPESEGRTGFLLYYHGEQRVSVARIPPQALERWRDDVYLKICTGQKPFRRKRIRYADYLTAKHAES